MKQNKIYTYNYSQPDEYHFSLDSVFLAQTVSAHIKHDPQLGNYQIADIGAGCGIIGLELSIHCPKINFIDFFEVQNIYLPFFNKNLKMIYGNDKCNFKFISENYDILKQPHYQSKYDIIVSNPPYFFTDEGMLSSSDFKNRCRFFMDSSFENLILGVTNSLNHTGLAFVLLRSGNHHGRNLLDEINPILNGVSFAKEIDNIRGAKVIQINK